jgi:hypothetical protein
MAAAMDYFNPDDWTKLETAFTSAPRWALVVAAGAGGCLLGWFLNGTRSAGKINGLEGEKGVLERQLKADTSLLEQRLKYAEEVRAASNKTDDEIDELKKRFAAIEVVVAKADYASLSDSVAEIRSAIAKVSAANNAVTMKLSVTETPDVAAFKVTAGETLGKLQGAGKPSLFEALKRNHGNAR